MKLGCSWLLVFLSALTFNIAPGSCTNTSLVLAPNNGHDAPCLMGWDFALSVRENTLNKILTKTIKKYFGAVPIPDLMYKDSPPKPMPGTTWAIKTTLGAKGLMMNDLRIKAVQGDVSQLGRIEATFQSGTLFMYTDVLDINTGKKLLPTSKQEFSIPGAIMTFKIRVTAFRLVFKQSGDKYIMRVEIIDKDAFVGELDFMKVPILQTKAIREGLTAFMRKILKKGRVEELAKFELPKRDPSKQSFIRKIFPHSIRFTFVYQKNNRSVLTALGTKETVEPDYLQFAAHDLIQGDSDMAMALAGDQFVKYVQDGSLDSIPLPVADHTIVTSSCPSEIKLDGERSYDIPNLPDWARGIVQGLISGTLKKFTIRFEGNQAFVEGVLLFDIKIWPLKEEVTFKFTLDITWNAATKSFDTRVTDRDHDTHSICPDWFKILKWFQWYIVLTDWILNKVAEDIITDAFVDITFKTSAGMPFNAGGAVGEFIDRMTVTRVGFYEGNWVFDFNLDL